MTGGSDAERETRKKSPISPSSSHNCMNLGGKDVKTRCSFTFFLFTAEQMAKRRLDGWMSVQVVDFGMWKSKSVSSAATWHSTARENGFDGF